MKRCTLYDKKLHLLAEKVSQTRYRVLALVQLDKELHLAVNRYEDFTTITATLRLKS